MNKVRIIQIEKKISRRLVSFEMSLEITVSVRSVLTAVNGYSVATIFQRTINDSVKQTLFSQLHFNFQITINHVFVKVT